MRILLLGTKKAAAVRAALGTLSFRWIAAALIWVGILATPVVAHSATDNCQISVATKLSAQEIDTQRRAFLRQAAEFAAAKELGFNESRIPEAYVPTAEEAEAVRRLTTRAKRNGDAAVLSLLQAILLKDFADIAKMSYWACNRSEGYPPLQAQIGALMASVREFESDALQDEDFLRRLLAVQATRSRLFALAGAAVRKSEVATVMLLKMSAILPQSPATARLGALALQWEASYLVVEQMLREDPDFIGKHKLISAEIYLRAGIPSSTIAEAFSAEALNALARGLWSVAAYGANAAAVAAWNHANRPTERMQVCVTIPNYGYQCETVITHEPFLTGAPMLRLP